MQMQKKLGKNAAAPESESGRVSHVSATVAL